MARPDIAWLQAFEATAIRSRIRRCRLSYHQAAAHQAHAFQASSLPRSYLSLSGKDGIFGVHSGHGRAKS
jgi:hypothetical protein